MIYTYDGIGSNTAFQYNDVQLQQAYSYVGVPLIDAVILTVMSYNVQDFSGINNQETMQRSIVTKYNPQIIGIQEFYKKDVVPSIATNMLEGYNLVRSNHKNFNAVASTLTLSNVVVADFSVQDPNDISKYNETRCYIKGYITFDNKQICFIDTHLCLTLEYQLQQMSELMQIVENEQYYILTGDFNNQGLSTSDTWWISLYKPLLDEGLNLANCANDVGFTMTYFGGTTPNNGNNSAPDNIITSSNITINRVVYDHTKFDNLDGNKIDHIPMIAYLTLN